MRIPLATYRLQFNPAFGFEDALEVVPYLDELGISDIYASPLLKARAGSQHGYDVVDPSRLNPELGTEHGFERLTDELRKRGMGLLLDIVPNHMAASTENPWWYDVLENGRHSSYSHTFDIDWTSGDGDPKGRLVLPILDRPYAEALQERQLRLLLDDAGFAVAYHDIRLPIDVRSYALILARCLGDDAVGPRVDNETDDLGRLLGSIRELPEPWSAPGADSDIAHRSRQEIKRRVHDLLAASPRMMSRASDVVEAINGGGSEEDGTGILDGLLQVQAYRLAYWREGLVGINYRRFFDISDLVGVRVEDEDVFTATHEFIFRLAREGKATGLRVDHVDGLHDPCAYLRKLQGHLDKSGTNGEMGFYVVVEKILTGDEPLREEWPVCGTTGYEFLNTLGAVFVDHEDFRALERAYSQLTGDDAGFEDVVYHAKKKVMAELFPAEVKGLSSRLGRLARRIGAGSGLSHEDVKDVLVEITACLPVYRTYSSAGMEAAADRGILEHAIRRAAERAPHLEGPCSELGREVFLDGGQRRDGDDGGRLDFVMRWQQFTGAVMAKGLEDTALYLYSPLVSLNEVGGRPVAVGSPVEAFHQSNSERQARWRYALSATATHDTKRGEDVRARINVLGEMPESWMEHVERWRGLNEAKKTSMGGCPVPDVSMELLLYQTMIGAWPVDEAQVDGFVERLKQYMVKAAREAKSFTNWHAPNAEYEDALASFVDRVLNGPEHDPFLSDFLGLQARVAIPGAVNSLSHVILKVASPGVPDFYQGTELWDLSLVDPDNRRPVDFDARSAMLNDLARWQEKDRPGLVRQLLANWRDGRMKLYVTRESLSVRAGRRDLFEQGQYVPLTASGPGSDHVCAFARCLGDQWVLAAVPRLVSRLASGEELPLGEGVWQDTVLRLPDGAPRKWKNAFTGESLSLASGTGGLSLGAVFRSFPVALLMDS